MSALPLWPLARSGDALAAVAAAASLEPRRVDTGPAPAGEAEHATWLDDAGALLGLEVDTVATPCDALAAASPALVRLGAGLLAIIGGSPRRLVVIDPDHRRVRVETEAVRAELHGQLADTYLIRRPPEASPRALARDRRLLDRLATIVVLHTVSQALWIGSWFAIGRMVLGAAMSAGWLAAWGLLFASSQAARLGVAWSSGRVAIDAAALLSQRLLAGALRHDADALKREGVGISLGRVLESNAVQSLAVTGGLQAMLAAIELVLAAVVLALGAGGVLHVILLAALLALAGLATRSYVAARRTWTGQRLDLTHELSEAMIGHATRLAQGDLDALEQHDDRALVRYHGASRAMDRAQWRLGVLVPMGWPVLAALGLAPVLLFGAPTAGTLAAALGGILLASQAIHRLADAATRIADATIAWRSVSALFDAAASAPQLAPPSLALAPASPDAPALRASAIGYRHVGCDAPVLAACDLVVERGARVLLEGSSGAGKSTLAAIIAGLRRPSSGLVLASGLDRASVGDRGWRRRVACAPQFHDNHIFCAPLAFNLLMARRWPPKADDLAAAESVCRDLGLGPLIARMPGGLFQQVGETGWQLSHGERSRVFLARALLQDATLLVLDESLAALDPENLALAIRCLEARAPATIVIAHP